MGLLTAERLQKYHDAIVAEGYSCVHDLIVADDDDTQQLVEDVQMTRGEAKRFLSAIAARKTAAAAAGPPIETREFPSCPICIEVYDQSQAIIPRIFGCGTVQLMIFPPTHHCGTLRYIKCARCTVRMRR